MIFRRTVLTHGRPYGAQGVALIGTAGLSTVLEARISGLIENGSNAGNIVIKFRSEVNASAVTVKRGSFGNFYKF